MPGQWLEPLERGQIQWRPRKPLVDICFGTPAPPNPPPLPPGLLARPISRPCPSLTPPPPPPPSSSSGLRIWAPLGSRVGLAGAPGPVAKAGPSYKEHTAAARRDALNPKPYRIYGTTPSKAPGEFTEQLPLKPQARSPTGVQSVWQGQTGSGPKPNAHAAPGFRV